MANVGQGDTSSTTFDFDRFYSSSSICKKRQSRLLTFRQLSSFFIEAENYRRLDATWMRHETLGLLFEKALAAGEVVVGMAASAIVLCMKVFASLLAFVP